MGKLASSWGRLTHKWWKRMLMTPVIGAILILAIWGIAEGLYQIKVARLADAVNGLSVYVESHGGTARSFFVKAPHYLDGAFCIDNGPCPQVTKAWLVLVDPQQESSFLHEAFQRAGYQKVVDLTPGAGANSGGTKNGVSVNAGFYPADDRQIPYPAPAGKQWLLFDATAD